MTNHPNRNRTYWLIHERGFCNEYTVGIATTKADAEQYSAEGFKRIDRDYALRLMSRRAGNGEQLYVGTTIDGEPAPRLETARAIRTGRAASWLA
jgi:hypothetical protein